MFGISLRMPAKGDRITADWAREVVRALRAMRLVAGPGIRLTRTPDGTTVTAADAGGAGMRRGQDGLDGQDGKDGEDEDDDPTPDPGEADEGGGESSPPSPPCGNPLNDGEADDDNPLDGEGDDNPLDGEGDGGFSPACGAGN